VGLAGDFRGVIDRRDATFTRFTRVARGATEAPEELVPADRAETEEGAAWTTARDELELLDGAGAELDRKAFLAAEATPVFFGSALTNFGVRKLLDAVVDLVPPPAPRDDIDGVPRPLDAPFSGFVFKVQANMDPSHRDRIAFLRVCSGKFTRDMAVIHARTGKKVRLSSSHKLFGQERETVDEAYPGDVIGLVGHDSFGIGDTLTTDPKILYKEIPRFTPEAFSYLHNPNTAKFKQFRQGLEQLLQEGVIQALYLRHSAIKVPLLAAVGPLQFEVVQFRLESEYGAVSRLEATPWTVVRWLPVDMKEDDLDALSLPTGCRVAYDVGKNPVVLFPNEWSADYFIKTNERVPLSAQPVQTARE
jgi:peptide chain release factor 3